MATRQSLTASFRVAYAAEDGEDACILALSNESEMVACDGLGNVSDVSTIEGTTWTFYVGNTAVDASEYEYTVKATGCSVEYSVDGAVGTVAVGAMSEDTATVEIEVAYDGTTYSRTYTLTKNKANISYALVVSPGVLAYDADGNCTGGAISIGVRVIDNGVATIYTDTTASGTLRTDYSLWVCGSVRTASSYVAISTSTGSYTISGSTAASALAAGGFTFYLVQGDSYSTGTIVDQETLEVVQNGANGNDGQDGEDGTSVKIAGKADYHFETWASAYSYTAGFTDTDITVLCDETGDLSDGTTATGTGAYVHAVDEDGNYTVTLATEGDCYVVNSGADTDADGHIWYATADAWEDLGRLAGSDGDPAEFYELRDAATYSDNYASAVTAAIGSVADDGTITENIAYALYVVLAHVVGDTTSYVASSSATVTANVIATETTTDEDTGEETITSGWQDVNFTRNGAVYYYTGTFSGVDLSDLPASIRVTATYGGNTYYLTVPVTLATDSYFSVTETIFASVYQNSTDIASNYTELTQTAEKVTALAATVSENSESIATLTTTATSISETVTTIKNDYVTSSDLEVAEGTITATVQSTYSKAGLTITDDTIVLTASQTYITDSDGNTIALFSDGKVSADLIDAESVFTTYLTASNAVLGDVTVEGSIVYAQRVLNSGTEEEYMHSIDDVGNGYVANYALDVCSLGGTLVIESIITNAAGFCLPFIDVQGTLWVRGYTKYNSAAWREMTFSDFRRLIGQEITLINNTGTDNVYLYLGNNYFVGNDTTPTGLTDAIYHMGANAIVTLAMDYSNDYGYIWRASTASKTATSDDTVMTPEEWMTEQDTSDVYWDLPTSSWSAEHRWSSAGVYSSVAGGFFTHTGPIYIPSGTTQVSIQTVATKYLNDAAYHYTIHSIYVGTTESGYDIADPTIILDNSSTFNGDGSVKEGGDGTIYRVDTDISGYRFLAVTFRVFTETEDGGTSTSGFEGLTAVTADLSTNVDIANLKILFY